MQIFEKQLLDFISTQFAQPGAVWQTIHAGEDHQVPVQHLLQYITGVRFHFCLIEFKIGSYTNYVVRVNDQIPHPHNGIVTFGSKLIEISWNNQRADKRFLMTKAECHIHGTKLLADPENVRFLTESFAKLTTLITVR